MSLATNEKATGQVRAITYSKLNELKDWLKETMEQEMQTGQYALFKYARSQIKLFQKDPEKVKLTIPLKAPMGPPI